MDQNLRGPFAHVDNLMGVRYETPADRLKREADAKAKQREMDAWAHEVNVLQEFQRTDAWTLLRQAWEREASMVKARLADCTDPVTLAKGVGALLLLEGYQNYPQDRVRELLQSLEDAKQS